MFKKIVIGFLLVVLLLAAAGYVYYRLYLYEAPLITEEDRAQTVLMPLPASLALTGGRIDISSGMNLTLTGNPDSRLQEFIRRKSHILPVTNDPEGAVGLVISVDGPPSEGSVKVREDESYTLDIDRGGIRIHSGSTIGALRGMATLVQLVQSAGDGTLPETEIRDEPRYPWRGLMLDVCRHWIPKEVVLRTLDAMEQVKLNVLHMHLSEDQGFRVESKVFPRLHEVGSNGKYYTQEEIREIIAYARDRGIRVVPEFDLPGHSKSWQIAYPQLSSVDFPLEFGSKRGVAFTAPVNPAREYTYRFLDAFIGEMAALFPDPYFHIGGDEVDPKYWLENDSIVMFMEQHQLEDAHALQTYFINRMNEIITSHGKTMIGWEEVYQEGLTEGVVIQSWKDQKSLFHAVRGGTPGILSAGYYLDLILPAENHYRIDPAVIPNAVEIKPDTLNWKMYDLTLYVGDNPMNSRLVLFDRDPSNLSGFMSMLDQLTAFTGGSIQDDELTFSMDTQYGTMNFSGNLRQDSIEGEISVAMIGVDVNGKRSGGSDMTDGRPLPKIEYLPPLNDQEKELILGGEACMWAEFVDANNVESRLWPRAAAIAEKLWSPARLTTDVPDMYRRLSFADSILIAGGIPSPGNSDRILQSICDGECYETLRSLSAIFEEVKYHARMTGLIESDSVYLPDFPLDRIVDAARPESPEARDFNEKVATYLSDTMAHAGLREGLTRQLAGWKGEAVRLHAYADSSPKLDEIRNLLDAIEITCQAAMDRLTGEAVQGGDDEMEKQLALLEQGEGYVIVAIYPGLRELIQAEKGE